MIFGGVTMEIIQNSIIEFNDDGSYDFSCKQNNSSCNCDEECRDCVKCAGDGICPDR